LEKKLEKIFKRRKGQVVPIHTDDDVRVILCRIRDNALHDWQYSIISGDYKNAQRAYKAVRDAREELAQMLAMVRADSSKLAGEIKLNFLSSLEEE
jgi:hypothetical protein